MAANLILPPGQAVADNKSDGSMDSDGKLDHEFLFDSALEVGSRFLSVNPETEIVFYLKDGVFVADFTIINTTKNAPIAFYLWTADQNKVSFIPKQGFIPAGFQQKIQLGQFCEPVRIC